MVMMVGGWGGSVEEGRGIFVDGRSLEGGAGLWQSRGSACEPGATRAKAAEPAFFLHPGQGAGSK